MNIHTYIFGGYPEETSATPTLPQTEPIEIRVDGKHT